MIETTIYVASLAIISATSMFAVFWNKYDDTLLQRVGLALSCMGATFRLLDMIDLIDANSNARYLMTYGIAIFCVGTAFKLRGKP